MPLPMFLIIPYKNAFLDFLLAVKLKMIQSIVEESRLQSNKITR